MNIQVSSSIEIKIEETVFKLSREDAYTLFNALKNQLNECTVPVTVPINVPTTVPNYPWYIILRQCGIHLITPHQIMFQSLINHD